MCTKIDSVHFRFTTSSTRKQHTFLLSARSMCSAVMFVYTIICHESLGAICNASSRFRAGTLSCKT